MPNLKNYVIYRKRTANYAIFELTSKRIVHVKAIEFDVLQMEASIHKYSETKILSTQDVCQYQHNFTNLVKKLT